MTTVPATLLCSYLEDQCAENVWSSSRRTNENGALNRKCMVLATFRDDIAIVDTLNELISIEDLIHGGTCDPPRTNHAPYAYPLGTNENIYIYLCIECIFVACCTVYRVLIVFGWDRNREGDSSLSKNNFQVYGNCRDNNGFNVYGFFFNFKTKILSIGLWCKFYGGLKQGTDVKIYFIYIYCS